MTTFVYVYHKYGATHEIKEFPNTAGAQREMEEFVFNHIDDERYKMRIFEGEELVWEPKDIVKSVRLRSRDAP